MTHRLVGDNCLCPVFDGETHKLGAALGIRCNCHDIEFFFLEHLFAVRIEGDFAISVTECLEALRVAVATGYEIDLGPVVEGLGIGGRGTLWQVLLVEMEPAVYVEFRGRLVYAVRGIDAQPIG